MQTTGECAYCGRELTRSGMARHLAACPARGKIVSEAEARMPRDPDGEQFHLQVHDAWSGDYWLHLEVDGFASLTRLDSYLRAIWLECCGHASQFSIGRWRGKQFGMARRVHEVFRAHSEVTHIYDFGTESVTVIKAVGRRSGPPLGKRPITLMARNALPALLCQECGAKATAFCMECAMMGDLPGTLVQCACPTSPA